MKYDISIQTDTNDYWRPDIVRVYDHHVQRTYEFTSDIQLRMFLNSLERKYDGIEIEHDSGDYEYPTAAPHKLRIFG